MNFFKGVLSDQDGRTTVAGDGYSIPLTESLQARLQNKSNKEVIVGLRPSAFHLTTGSNESVQLDLPVILSEYIGSQSVIVSRIGQDQIFIEVDSDTPFSMNEVLNFEVDPESLYLFDAETEDSL